MPPSNQGWIDRLRRRLPMFREFVVQRFRHGERYGLDFSLAFLAILGALWIFVELVESAVTESDLQSLDAYIQTVMSALFTPQLTEVVIFITDLGGTRGTTLGVLVVGIPLLLTRRWWSLFGLVFATAGGGVIVWGLKTFFTRARPEDPIIHAGGYAFPSGHAFAAVVFYGYLIYLAHRHIRSALVQTIVTILGFSLIVLIGTSRVYLNVHWLTDVMGGFLAGFAWLILSILIVRHVEWPRRQILRPESRRASDAPPGGT